MAAAVGKYAANKMLKKHIKGYENKKVEGGDDPYFALIEDPKRPGKFKKVKKVIPAYIPEHDANVLASVRKTAYHLDMSLFNLFGIRFGWEAVIGIIPGFGDVIGVFMALMLVKKCQKVDGGLPSTVSTQMMLNVIIDFLLGLVPFLGDIADAAFKANTKNCRLLEQHLDKKYKTTDMRDDRNYGGDSATRSKNRKSGIFHWSDPPPATAFDDSDGEDDRRAYGHQQTAAPQVQQPVIAQSRQENGRTGRI